MIGTSIRSVRHLHRVVSDTSLKTALIKFGKEGAWDVCKVFKFPKNSQFNEALVVFNNFVRQSPWGMDTITSTNEFRKFGNPQGIYEHYARVIALQESEFPHYSHLFSEITLLPDTFDKDYENFFKENSKMVNNLMSTYGFNNRDIRAKRIYIYCDGSKNFFQWAINAYYKNGIALATIKSILLWNDSYKQLAKNLSKGTITAYTSRDSIVPLMKELSELRKEKRINDSINSFNTLQKRMLKENELSEDDKQALWRFSKLSDTKRLNFIKKMSSVDKIDELKRQLRFVTSVHFSWSKESFMDFIENVEEIKYEKIFENDNIVLVKTIDYETVKQLGKTTNWCISKNKSYWNNYIENYHGQTTQYMVFDFSKLEDDKLSIIGFTTTHNKGITSAHNFVNEDLMGGNPNDQTLLNSFIERFKENRNIYNILNDDGIDITLVVEYDKPPYKWDKNGIMDYLYECVNPENVEVLRSSDERIVLSVNDQNIRYFFGDAYHDNIPSEYYQNQHIIFIDFTKSKYDINKIQFGIIEEGYGDEDYCASVYNERSLQNGKNFDSLLIEFGLPYNTIRRTNNPLVRLRNAITSFNTPLMEESMKDCTPSQLRSVIKNEIGQDSLFDLILRSVDNHMSFDYLNLIYNNGLRLRDVMAMEYVRDIIKNFAQNMRSISRASANFTTMSGVTDSEIKDFYDLKTERREDTKYIGYYIVIKTILEKEDVSGSACNDLCRNFLNYMCGLNKQVEVYEQLINLVKDKLDYKCKHESLQYLAKYAIFYGTDGLKEFVFEKAKGSDFLSKWIEIYKKEYERYKERLEASKMASSHSNTSSSIFATVTIGTDANEYGYVIAPHF